MLLLLMLLLAIFGYYYYIKEIKDGINRPAIEFSSDYKSVISVTSTEKDLLEDVIVISSPLFMSANMIVSSMALVRSTEREHDIVAESGWQKVMDERFPDERLSKIYPNMIQVD